MREGEIRPKKIFDEYLRLAKNDTIKYFKDCKREKILCPACNEKGNLAFEKHSFNYFKCNFVKLFT